MPRYDYRCPKCNHVEDVFEQPNDNELLKHECPRCTEPMKRLLSSVPHVWARNNLKIRNGVPE